MFLSDTFVTMVTNPDRDWVFFLWFSMCLVYNEYVLQKGLIPHVKPSISPLPHDTVRQLFLLFNVGMISACSLAAFAVVTAENGGQLLLGHPVGGQGDGAFLGQAPAVLHKTQIKYRQFNNWVCGEAATLLNRTN